MHSMLKTKIRSLASVLPPELDAEREELEEIADTLPRDHLGNDKYRIEAIVRIVWRKAGPSGTVPSNFPQANEARQYAFELENALDV